MIWFLRIAFSLVVITMLIVTTWASEYVALWDLPRTISGHPWFIATLFDTYFAFLTFYCWVAYKETSVVARVVWLLLILILGNIAIGSYMAWQLWRLPDDAPIRDLLLRKA